MVENPESFSLVEFQDNYSLKEWEYLTKLCETTSLVPKEELRKNCENK